MRCCLWALCSHVALSGVTGCQRVRGASHCGRQVLPLLPLSTAATPVTGRPREGSHRRGASPIVPLQLASSCCPPPDLLSGLQHCVRRGLASSKSRATTACATNCDAPDWLPILGQDRFRRTSWPSSTPPHGLARLASRCLRNIIDNPPSTFDLRTHPGQPRATLEMLPRP